MKNLLLKRIKKMAIAVLATMFIACFGLAFVMMPKTAYANGNTEMTIQVSQETAKAGETVQVKINLVNNPGVASLKLNVAYEDFLTLENIEYNSSLGGQATSSNYIQDGSPATLIWVNAFENFTNDGVFASLTFKIDDDAAEDSFSEISVSYNPADIYNVDETDIDLNVINGYVYITSCVAGDINGDGNVNNKDITRLFQYLANWNVTVNEDALDVNGDGSVNNKDITRLFQYLANWDVNIYVRKPCIVTFNGNGGTLISGKTSQAVKKGCSATAPVYEREGYTFEGFDIDYTNVTKDLIVTAQWKENAKKLETPVISKIEYDTIYWSPVDNADYYTVRVNDNYERVLRGSACSLSDVKWDGNTISNYGYVSVKVMANENGEYLNSDWSADNSSYYYVPEIKSSTTDSLIKYSIGFGYNLIEDEYLDITKCSNISVFNVGKLLTIGNYTARPHSGGTGTSYYYRSIDEFISKTKVSVEYGQTTGCVLLGSIKMQINVDLGFDYRSYKYNETYIYEYNWTYKDHIITNFASDNLLMYCLSDSFLKDIKRESDNTVGMNDNQLCAYIYDTYGTHAILGITTGGTYIADYIISTNDTDIAASVDVAFNLSTGGGGAIDQIIQKDFNIGIDVSENLSWKNSTTEAHYTTHIYGGSGGGSTTASGVDAAIKTWTNSLSEDNARSVKFTENGAIALSSLISYIDSGFAQKFANYVNSKADEAYHTLFDQYTKPTTLPMSVNTENGKNVLRVDVSSYQSAGTLGDAYNPNLLNNILTVYPIMYGKETDKIVVIGAFDEHKTLIDNFSLELSAQWKRNVEIEFENCGFVCASENGLVDDSKVTKNINIDISYKGINYIADRQGNNILRASIHDRLYDFVFDVGQGVSLDLSTIRISGGDLALADAEKANYTFLGWYDNNNIQVTDELGNVHNSYALTDTVVLHAVFTPVKYAITLNNQYANSVGTQAIYERYEDDLYSDENCTKEIEFIVIPQKTGYVFDGYYESVENNSSTNAVGTNKRIDGNGNFVNFNSTTFTEKKTLYALWKPATFTITLDNGDGIDNTTIISTYNAGFSLNQVSVPEKVGYTFGGYYISVSSNNTELATGDTKVITENGNILFDCISILEDVTYYALWIKCEFTVTLDLNGGENNSGNIGGYSSLKDTALPTESQMSRFGYTFNGWYNENNEKVTTILKGTTGDLVFTAHWSVNPYTISQYISGNTATVSDTWNGGKTYTVYKGIDNTPWSPSEYCIIDWREENDLNLGNHTNRNNVLPDWAKGRLGAMDIYTSTKEVYFIGNGKTFENFSFAICQFYQNDKLKIGFKDFKFNVGFSIGEYDTKSLGSNLTIEVKGDCAIGTNVAGGDVLSLSSFNILFTGEGSLVIKGGNGANATSDGSDGGNGGTGLIANSITVDIVGDLTVYGGNGGNGARGYTGSTGANGADRGRGNQKGGNGTDGGVGGTGGKGGNGASAIIVSTVNLESKLVVFSGNGGTGGKGGTGGTGGKGGQGGSDYNFFNTSAGAGGDGGYGGAGGTGGKGGDVNKAIISSEIVNSFYLTQINGSLGAGGAGGAGGYGGAGGAGGWKCTGAGSLYDSVDMKQMASGTSHTSEQANSGVQGATGIYL